ncbi:NADH-quinone oxidoreductase subunit H [Candidatus Bathyarchaeota archaeon]|nr:MAG: NADH-quinone oxidoreductase subunit H [Candidatus Bathyarchaeota archaeon]
MAQNPFTLIFQILVFPGAAFLILLAFLLEWVDRKVVARIQSRYGPLYTGPSGILQPIADFLKLLSKEDITPEWADRPVFTLAPIIYFALPLTALFLIPITGETALASFEGDLILLMFILTLLIITVFLAGYCSASPFSVIGGVRAALQMIGYEIPMALALLGPALASGTLSVSGIVQWQSLNGLWIVLLQPLGFGILIVCMLAELEFVPFDIPEAETEIVAGWMTEFSGRKLALFRLGKNLKVLLASAIISSIYLGGAHSTNLIPPVIIFLVKTFILVVLLSFLRAVFARLRIDQMVSGMWKYLIPLAILQIILVSVGLGG